MRGPSYLIGVVFAGLVSVVLPAAPAWAAGGGTLDPSFGPGGKVLTDFGGQDMAYGMAIQRDGKIVAAGLANTGGDYDFALARYNDDGTLDTTFGAGGKVLTDVSGDAYALAVQPDGRIVAAGTSNTDFALIRYHRDGSLDTTLGGGRALTDFGGNDYAYALAIRPDGKIVVAGFSDVYGSNDFALTRYHNDGTPDSTFGGGGWVLSDVSGASSDDEVRAVTVQPDGKIVAAGGSNAVHGTDQDFALARYDNDGALDTSFGIGGIVLTDVTGAGSYDVCLALTVQPDGKIMVAGSAGRVRNADSALARYNNHGGLDTAFGNRGTVVTDVSGAGLDDDAFAVAVQTDGKIVTAGVASGAGWSDFAMARYQP
jgi:uncharacterized delta-60 repeat protein